MSRRSSVIVKPNEGYDFENYIQSDGANDRGDMASSFAVNTSDFVISFWVKSDGSNVVNMICGDSIISANYLYLRTSSPTVRLASTDSGPNTTADWNGITWDDDTWHHFYFFLGATGAQFVFDGVDKGIGGGWEGMDIDALFLRPISTPFYANVGLDDFIASNETGSVAQAQELYNGGAGKNPASVLSLTDSIWYKFNQTNGTTVIPNNGSSSNDLTLSNFTGTYLQPH